MENKTTIQHVSDTAFWVAYYRALESDRADALFKDPFAKILAGEQGMKIVKAMGEKSKYSYWTLVMRTKLIDDYITDYINQGCTTIINLGAGLDTRPYRLNFNQKVKWIEVDFKNVIDFKNEKLKNEIAQCNLERIAADLSNREERQKLFAEINSRVGPALVLTEGVTPYLTETQVAELAQDIKANSNFQFWLTEYYSKQLYKRFQSEQFKKIMKGAPFQFFPQDWLAFFEQNGWVKKEMQYLIDVSNKHGRKFPYPPFVWVFKILFGEEAVARKSRFSAYVIFQKT